MIMQHKTTIIAKAIIVVLKNKAVDLAALNLSISLFLNYDYKPSAFFTGA